MLGLPLGAWKLVAIAALVAVIGGYIGWLKWDIAELRAELATTAAERDEARGAAQRNYDELVRLTDAKASAEKRAAAAEIRVATADKRRAELLKQITREVHHAPKTDADRCAMPGAVAAALERLRVAREDAAGARGPR